MAQNFTTESTQGAIMVNVPASNGGTVVLKDSGGNTLASFTPTKSFNCVVVSVPEIKVGETYTVAAGNSEVNVSISTLIYGQTQGMGGKGQGGSRPKMW